ncbi:DinI-like family protein [Citrobacter sp. FDAARGOS_156]|nr:DinI-like family protein [Citrobacter sp. FDAARGOS_156]
MKGAKDIILDELSKRVHRIFPDADITVFLPQHMK